ncbi:transcriptional regulator YeiL [Peribacillus frigoritolerans]|uniref:transcriptional regulator YeiL n=1 Tax=Peribacillus frigoritolerans TaxID=450367 RepID=UPI0039A2B94E
MEKINLKDYAENFVDIYNDIQETFPKAVLHQAFICKFSSNEYIVRFDEDIQYLFLLLDGRAKIYIVHENGKRALIQFLKKDDFIGELSLIEVEKNLKDVVAINDCTCLAVPLASSKEHLLNDNRFLQNLSKYLGDKLLKRTDHYTDMQDYEFKNRLAKYILQIENDGCFQEKHTETAEYVGGSYRHLLYTLNQFHEEGLLEKKGRKYYIINKKKLERLSSKKD